MEVDNPNGEADASVNRGSRPLLLSVLCLFSFVFFGLVSILYLIGLFNAGWITRVTNQYISAGELTTLQTVFIFSAGFILHSLALTGVWLVWKLRRYGYLFLGPSCLVITVFQLFNPQVSFTSTAIYIILVMLFGIFYRYLH